MQSLFKAEKKGIYWFPNLIDYDKVLICFKKKSHFPVPLSKSAIGMKFSQTWCSSGVFGVEQILYFTFLSWTDFHFLHEKYIHPLNEMLS